jgi:hypothetical protein
MAKINYNKIKFYYSIIANSSLFIFVFYVYLFIPEEFSRDPLAIMRFFPLNLPHFSIAIISSSIIISIIFCKIIVDLWRSEKEVPFYLKIELWDYLRIAILLFSAGQFFEKQEAPYIRYQLLLLFLIICSIKMVGSQDSDQWRHYWKKYSLEGKDDSGVAMVPVSITFLFSIILFCSLTHHYGKEGVYGLSFFMKTKQYNSIDNTVFLAKVSKEFVEKANSHKDSLYKLDSTSEGSIKFNGLTMPKRSAYLTSGIREAFIKGWNIYEDKDERTLLTTNQWTQSYESEGKMRPIYEESLFGKPSWFYLNNVDGSRNIILIRKILVNGEYIKIVKQSQIHRDAIMNSPITLEDINGDLWWACVAWCRDPNYDYLDFWPKYNVQKLVDKFY